MYFGRLLGTFISMDLGRLLKLHGEVRHTYPKDPKSPHAHIAPTCAWEGFLIPFLRCLSMHCNAYISDLCKHYRLGTRGDSRDVAASMPAKLRIPRIHRQQHLRRSWFNASLVILHVGLFCSIQYIDAHARACHIRAGPPIRTECDCKTTRGVQSRSHFATQQASNIE